MSKSFRGSGNIAIPAGVTSIKVYTAPLRRHIVAGGGNSIFALKADGSAWAWGRGLSGQLGNNSASNVSSPSAVTGGHIFTEIAGGGAGGGGTLSCAARKADGSVWCWGDNSVGQLGNNSTTGTSSPVLVVGGNQFVEISSRGGTVSARKADGSVWGWGDNSSGGLGDNTLTSRSSPVAVVGGHQFVQITSGSGRTMGLKADGSAWGWGSNGSGQLGNNTTTSVSSPVAVVGGHVFVEISGTGSHSLGRKADGSVWGWGDNSSGQFGDNSLTARSSPVQVAAGGGIYAQVLATASYSLFRRTDGTVWGSGFNGSGILGNNNTTTVSSPVQVAGGGLYVEIAAGTEGSHSLARRADGSVWAWGSNSFGELGDNTTNDHSSPTQVAGPAFAPLSPDNDPQALKRTVMAVTPGAVLPYTTGVLGSLDSTLLDVGVDSISPEFGSQSFITATGGTITTNGNFKVHTFTSSGTFQITSGSGQASSLVVAGGGGANGASGASAGGGGAGGLLYTTPGSVYGPGSYTVTVGNGGTGQANGQNSVFDTITATGGGYSGSAASSPQYNGGNGGSGGGAGPAAAGVPGTGIAGQGFGGGTGASDVNTTAGGGGGAGSVGENHIADVRSGNGGTGVSNSITGTPTFYASGGGAGSQNLPAGTASAGGGGAGATGLNTAATNGTANTGGGAGGGQTNTTGGSGIVIVTYQFQ